MGTTPQASRHSTREVVCPHCDHSLEIPASAMSVNCPHCNRRVIIEDLTIKSFHAVVRLATAGLLEVARNAHVVAEVRVHDLVVEGTVRGDVTATDRVEVGKKGSIVGDVVCRRLKVEPGALLQGRYEVGEGAGGGERAGGVPPPSPAD
ncbi:MAG: polymer-forming cytoskeletal protein [Planctomycetaceae bacterium]